jgi:enoyl-CoA hydratase
MPDAAAFDTPSAPILNVADGRAIVRLNRPRQHNRIEPQDLVALEQSFAHIDSDPSIRVLTLTASGKSFSSGFHIGALVECRAGTGDDPDPTPSSAPWTGSNSCGCRRSPR